MDIVTLIVGIAIGVGLVLAVFGTISSHRSEEVHTSNIKALSRIESLAKQS